MLAYYKKKGLIFEISYKKEIEGIRLVEKFENKKERSSLSDQAFREISLYLDGKLEKFSFPINIKGTDFQKRVRREIEKIPYGKTISYKKIGEKINSKAYQAIGTACGKNPILLRIPCHRVVGSKDMGGFAYGVYLKKKLLELEGALFNFNTNIK